MGVEKTLITVVVFTVSAGDQPEVAKHYYLDDLNEIVEFLDNLDDDDPNRDQKMRSFMGLFYLQCAAVFKAISESVASTRPDLAKFYNDVKNRL